MNSFVVILCVQNQLSAWKVHSASAVTRLKIHGQGTLPVSSSKALREGYADLDERLRGEGFHPDVIHWLVDQSGRKLLAEGLPHVDSIAALQLISWEWLSNRLGLANSAPMDDDMKSLILPWLSANDETAEREQMQEALAMEHRSEAERLTVERQKLLQENERLRAQNTAFQQVDAENLLRFLPALYPRVFTILGAADLALLSGRIEPLAIPNPYPEPSEETLRALQRDFRDLPRPIQQQILAFIRRLPHQPNLQVRTEMRELVYELERG